MVGYPGMGGGKAPDTSISIPVVGMFPPKPKKRKKKVVRKNRAPIMNGAPTKSGNARTPIGPGASAGTGWRTGP